MAVCMAGEVEEEATTQGGEEGEVSFVCLFGDVYMSSLVVYSSNHYVHLTLGGFQVAEVAWTTTGAPAILTSTEGRTERGDTPIIIAQLQWERSTGLPIHPGGIVVEVQLGVVEWAWLTRPPVRLEGVRDPGPLVTATGGVRLPPRQMRSHRVRQTGAPTGTLPQVLPVRSLPLSHIIQLRKHLVVDIGGLAVDLSCTLVKNILFCEYDCSLCCYTMYMHMRECQYFSYTVYSIAWSLCGSVC